MDILRTVNVGRAQYGTKFMRNTRYCSLTNGSLTASRLPTLLAPNCEHEL
jgi:hypothetical protein